MSAGFDGSLPFPVTSLLLLRHLFWDAWRSAGKGPLFACSIDFRELSLGAVSAQALPSVPVLLLL